MERQTYITLRLPNRCRKVFDGEGNVVATFEPSVLGEFAFGAFMAALAPYGGVCLFDQDTQEYLVGTVDQLLA